MPDFLTYFQAPPTNTRYSIIAGSLSTTLISNSFGSELTGSIQKDILVSRGKNDKLTGGLGGDTFVFTSGLNFINSLSGDRNRVDHITDFNASEGDAIRIDSKAKEFKANKNTEKKLITTTFEALDGSKGANLGASSARFVFDTSTGSLYLNRNGTSNRPNDPFGAGGGLFAVLAPVNGTIPSLSGLTYAPGTGV